MEKIELRKLEIFSVVAYHESISKAAEELFISQPAVSKVIKEIETEIDTLLFDRVSGKIKLNKEGELFLNRSNQLLEELEGLKNFKASSHLKREIKLGVSRTIGEFVLPQVLRGFQAVNKTPVKVLIDNAEEIKGKLLTGAIDFAYIEGNLLGKEFQSIPVSSYKLLFVAKEDLGVVSLEELLESPLLLREKGSSLRDIFERETRSLGWRVRPIVESISNEALIRLTKEGLGIAVLPDIMAKELIKAKELEEVLVPELSLKSDNHLIQLKRKELTEDMEELIRLLCPPR